MPSDWRQVPFGDCVSLLSGGTPSKAQNAYWGGTIPWVSSKELWRERIYTTDDLLTEEGAASGTRMVPGGTVLFVVRSMVLANRFPVSIAMRPVAFNQDIKAVVCGHSVTPLFVYYWLRANEYEVLGRVDEAGHGTKRLQIDRLSEMIVDVPPLPVQRHITNVLSAYDDLIENCERRIRVLDQMARALYREWFVLFRYPGHEKTPLVDSRVGTIPKGWRALTISAATSFLSRGISPTYRDDGPSTVINQKCIRDHRLDMAPARRQCKPIPPERSVRMGDVLINSTGVGTLGRVAQVLDDLNDCTVDSHVTIVRRNQEVTESYLGLSLLSLQPEFERKGVGATGQTELSRSAIGDIDLLVPPREYQEDFDGLVGPMRVATQVLQKRIENLRQTRDLLLPRLLSGQLSVEPAA